MRHVETARKETDNKFIKVKNVEDVKGLAPLVTFEIQSDPISEVGINGCQVIDIIEFAKNLIKSLNDVFPCSENSIAITKLEEAIHWQNHRTAGRIKRGVEGKMKG